MKKTSTKVFLLFLSVLFTNQAFSQSPLNIDVFPPTPNSAALAKFGDVPVGLTTGIPSVNVPVYSYKGNGLDFNISLDYHAGGVKVEEIASDVGIGWALSSGGQVSRTVRGLPDDIKGSGYFYSGNLQTFNHYLLTVAPTNGGAIHPADSLWLFYKNLKDSQSDIFNYSIHGKSGKFIYGLDGSYVTIPQSKIKIQRILDPNADSNYSLTGFIITDIDGTQYSFTKRDIVLVNSMGVAAGYSYSSSWNLTKIVSPFKTDSISISYETYGLNYQLGKYENKYTWINGALFSIANQTASGINNYSGNANRIKKISFPDSTHLTFNYESMDRKDISASGALKEIVVSNGNKSYGYHLYHSYGSNGAYTSGTVSSLYRLQLDSVAQFTGTTYLPSYKFTYNGTMPNRLSTAQDYWGFPYDSIGRANSNSLIPKIQVSAEVFYDGASRRPDTVKAKIGTLTSVQYPTGGRTDFTFESNHGDSKLDEFVSEPITVHSGTLIANHSQNLPLIEHWITLHQLLLSS